jgi:regulator of extracellular matrix RemA (YlzA/DUF370 family)
MGKLKELVGKGVRLIVTETEGGPADAPREREITAQEFEQIEPKAVARSEVPADVADFTAVYREAEIELPAHGYGLDKVAEMLQGKRLASLGREVKATAVLAALEAAGVPIKDVIDDAVLRDKALDAFEESKGREVRELHAKADARIQAIKDEIESVLREKNAEMEGLKKAAETADQAFLGLQTRKRREEERLHEVVSHFLEGAANPITTSAGAAASSPPPPKPGPA